MTEPVANGSRSTPAQDLDVGQGQQVDVHLVVGVRLLARADLDPHGDSAALRRTRFAASGRAIVFTTFAGRPATTV